MRGRPVTGKDNKLRISITLDPELLELIREKADEDDRSLSQFINLSMRKYLEMIREEES